MDGQRLSRGRVGAGYGLERGRMVILEEQGGGNQGGMFVDAKSKSPRGGSC